MENSLEVKRVPFMGTELIAARDGDGQIWAGVRWMCDGLGLSEGQRKRQIANIQTDRVLSKGGSNLILNREGYGDREVLCLALDFVPLWLAKISITPTMEAENPELAATLEQYQLRAKDVLAAAFLPVNAAPNMDSLSPTLRVLINLELQQKEQARALEAHDQELRDVNQRLDGIRDVVTLHPNQWREECRRLLAKVAQARGGGGAYQEVNAEVYQLVDERARVSLETRLTNKRRRMADEGVCKSRRDRLSKMDVIADDAKLIEIYTAVVKEVAIQAGVTADREGVT